MGSCGGDNEAPIIPDKLDQFTPAWAEAVMKTWFEKNEQAQIAKSFANSFIKV